MAAPTISSVKFDKTSYAPGDTITATVKLTAQENGTLVVSATDDVDGTASAATRAPFAIDATAPPPPPTPSTGVLITGATTGKGTGNAHATPDLAGWQSYQKKTGTYAEVTKLFAPGSGYPNLWKTWAGSLGEQFAKNNGGNPLLVIVCFNNVPTAGAFQALLQTLPATQRLGFVYESEPENTSSGINGPTFVANSHTISQNLNAALSAMKAKPAGGNDAGFYTRANFPIVNSAYMAYYSAHPGSTAFIPALGDVDAYGADFYHKGSKTNNTCVQDSRFAGYVKAVQAKVGKNVAYCFPEYGIDGAAIASDAARGALLTADYNAMTGPNAPGTKGLLLWNYWFEVGNSGQQYLFSTPSATASAWQKINSV